MTLIFLLLGLAVSLIINVELDQRKNNKEDEQKKQKRI